MILIVCFMTIEKHFKIFLPFRKEFPRFLYNFAKLLFQNVMREKIMSNIAISIVAYERVDSLSRLLASLEKAYYDNDTADLFISIDKSNTDAVEQYADAYQWRYGEKHVVKHEKNLGLRKHVLSQGQRLENYDAVVVLEDDLVVARDFWNYVRQTVARYSSDDTIAGISLYSFGVNYHLRHPFLPQRDGNDVFFMNCAMSWGQVWMKRQWHAFMEWYKEHPDFPDMPHLPQSICSWGNKSWLKYHTRYCIEENKYFVFPYVSYTTNYSDAGTHMEESDHIYQVPLLQGRINSLRLPELTGNCVRYDGFFENKALYEKLGLSEEECCLDLSGSNGNRTGKRFWLTTRLLPYKVCKEYNFSCRPLEQNVLDECPGTGIFLYDTSVHEKRKDLPGNTPFLAMHFIQNSFLFIREYGYSNFIRDFVTIVKRKLR